jgi:copper chaperone NosL
MKNTIMLALLAGLLATGCSQSNGASGTATAPAPSDADVETCSACGMVVREQPAPRGQVVHRDGTRAFFCSVGDLLQYLEIPSPHGKPTAVYSEAMPPEHTLTDLDTEWKPWTAVGDLAFVTDISREGVMGKPVMAYATREAAEKSAATFGGKVKSFTELQQKR